MADKHDTAFSTRPAPSAEGGVRASAVRVVRRPDAQSLAHDEARLVPLDEFMAIQSSAVERAFFRSLFGGGGDDKPYQMHGSVAVVCVDGPLMQRGGYWFDGYARIRERFKAALDDSAVTAVVLKINSPGGVCAGCFSAVRAMSAEKEASGKPVIAYADESAYSAAYAIACVADTIVVPPEGGVGSVGVIGTLQDWTAFNDAMGVRVAVITSGAQKADGHPDTPLRPEVIARFQTRINELAASFADIVASSRSMTSADVLKLEAGCFHGDGAVRAGLADKVATLEEAIAMASPAAKSVRAASRAEDPAPAPAATLTRSVRVVRRV